MELDVTPPNAFVDVDAFDPRDPRMSVDPYPIYRALRARDPVHWVAGANMWVVTSYREVMDICTNDAIFQHRYEHREVSRQGEQVREQAYFNAIRRMVFMMDGDDHRRLRMLFAKWFLSPGRMRALAPVIDKIANELMDDLASDHEFDIVQDFAYQLPLRVIGELFQVPREDHQLIAHSIEAIVPLAEGSVPKTPDVLERGNSAVRKLADYFGDLAKARRRAMGDDLLSSMIEAATAGGFADEEEMLANIVLVYFAGHDTTMASTSLSVLALHRHPDQLAKLRAEPELMRQAVEELIRFEPPGQGIGRIPIKDVTVGGKAIKAGQMILCYLAAANRDPTIFEDPDALILDRPAHKMASFAAGVHTCLGNLLARQEVSIALATLLARRPNLQLATLNPPASAFKPFAVSRGLLTLMAQG